MRLFDRLRADPQAPDYVRDGLRRATIVVADNVAEYYWSGTDQEYWEVNVHFPNLAPPWPCMWIETVAPKEIRSTEHPPLPWSPQAPKGWAVLRQAIDLTTFVLGPEEYQQGRAHVEELITHQMKLLYPILQKAYQAGGGNPETGLAALSESERMQLEYLLMLVKGGQLLDGSNLVDLVGELAATKNVRWLIHDHVFIDDNSGILPYPFWTFQYYIGADGSFERMGDSGWYTGGPLRSPRSERILRHTTRQALDSLSSHVVALWHTSLLTVSFLHCKNVGRNEVDPVAQWRARNPKKKGYAPVLAKYYVLDIHPMKEVLRREGRSAEVGLPRALSICRGHFAHYEDAEGKRLFGKYAGTVWRPMHLRGTSEVGAVEKDYRVFPPDTGKGSQKPQ